MVGAMKHHVLLILMWAAACVVNAQAAAPASAGLDHFAAGSNVRISEAVAGDLVAAAGTLDVDAPVAGDALLFGGTVRLGAGVSRSVYAAAGRLNLHGPVGHNLRVAGGQVELLPQASVAGNVSVGGGQVTLRGPVQGDVRVGGGTVLIDGPVQGDVWVSAGEVQLGPKARLAGALHWRSDKELQRDPAAQVAGVVDRMAWPVTQRGMHHDNERDGDNMPMRAGQREWQRDWQHDWGSHSMITGGWWWNLGLMLLAAVLVAALPGATQSITITLRTRGPLSLLVGFVVIACVPVAALLLLITLIGAPLALVLLLLLPPLLIVGYVSLGVAAGQWALSRWQAPLASKTHWQVAAAALSVLLLALLASVPVLGPLVAVLAVLCGVGLIALQWQRRGAKTPAAA
jgi:cytoskeletal protein CcmA (bactofilin family)